MGCMLDSDWSRKFLLRCDWLVLFVASYTTLEFGLTSTRSPSTTSERVTYRNNSWYAHASPRVKKEPPPLPSFLPSYFRVRAFSIQRTRLYRSLEQAKIRGEGSERTTAVLPASLADDWSCVLSVESTGNVGKQEVVFPLIYFSSQDFIFSYCARFEKADETHKVSFKSCPLSCLVLW